MNENENENFHLEKATNNITTTREGNKKIGEQMDKCVCKIKGEQEGSGFFIKIPSLNGKKAIPVLVTNNHIITIKNIQNKDNVILYNFNKEKEEKLKDMDKRKRYSNEILDITFIEIRDTDGIGDEHFLDIDDYEFDNDENIFKETLKTKYKEKAIYNISFPKLGELNDVKVSYGNAGSTYEGTYKLQHYCNTHDGSSGSPILSLETFKVFGVHFGSDNMHKKNFCTIIFPAINQFINTNNIITTIYDPEKQENKGKIDSKNQPPLSKENFEPSSYSNTITIKYKVKIHDEKIKIFGKKFVENNKKNFKIELINNQIKNYFDLDEFQIVNEKMRKDGYVEIRLIAINPIKNMSFMFGKASYDEPPVRIQEIVEFKNWSTKDVTNMSKLFCECNELISLPDLKFFTTEKVTDMSFMFFGCEKLKDIKGIGNWKTEKVKNMSNMFAYCRNLNFIDSLAKWNVENVEDMSYMFYECRFLQKIDGLETWFPKNIINYNYFIAGCKILANKPDLSLWKRKTEK